jgi:hypothetical protein
MSQHDSHDGEMVNALSPGPTKSRFGDNMAGFPLFFSRDDEADAAVQEPAGGRAYLGLPGHVT